MPAPESAETAILPSVRSASSRSALVSTSSTSPSSVACASAWTTTAARGRSGASSSSYQSTGAGRGSSMSCGSSVSPMAKTAAPAVTSAWAAMRPVKTTASPQLSAV